MAGIVWTQNSRVKVSGTINGVVTGTMDGKISSISNGQLTLSELSSENSALVTAGTYSASQFSDLTVMVYQRRVVENNTNYDYRVGIWMNCYDFSNDSATIRVYGGTSATPNVTIGNLKGMTFNGKTIGTNIAQNDTWGILTSMGFFSGAIISTEGQIGGFTIGQDILKSGDLGGTNSVVMSIGTSGTGGQANIAGSGSISGWAFTASNKFGVTKGGDLYASSAHISGTLVAGANSTIGPWTVTATSIYKTNSTMGNSTTGAAYFGDDGLSLTDKFKVTAAGALTATGGGTIGPWAFNTTYFRNGNIANATNKTVAGVYLGTDGLNISNGTAATTAYITKTAVNIGNKLTWDGSALSVEGTITATSGTIGGVTANSSYGLYTNNKTASNSTNAGFLISKDGAIYLGPYDSTAGVCPFQVTSQGVLTANSATITGQINADSGHIGGFSIDDGKLIYGSGETLFVIAPNGVIIIDGANANNENYIDEDEIDEDSVIWETTVEQQGALGYKMIVGNNFTVDEYGVMRCSSGYLTGTISADAGRIGQWAIEGGRLVGTSYSRDFGSSVNITNKTYLYSGPNDTSRTLTTSIQSSTLHITPNTGNVGIRANFSTIPVHPHNAGLYLSYLYKVDVGVWILNYSGYVSIKYSYEYYGLPGVGVKEKRVWVTSGSVVYQQIELPETSNCFENINVQVIYESPTEGNTIQTECRLYKFGDHTRIDYYAVPVDAHYLDDYAVMTIERTPTGEETETTFSLDRLGSLYAKKEIFTDGRIVANELVVGSISVSDSIDADYGLVSAESFIGESMILTGRFDGTSITLSGSLTASSGTITANRFSGPLTGNVTGNVTGKLNGEVRTYPTIDSGTPSQHDMQPIGSGSNNKERISYLRGSSGNSGRFCCVGQLNTTDTGTWFVAMTSSDKRLKENIKDTSVNNALSAVNLMKIREFDWIEGKHENIGFVADELEEIDSCLTIGGGYDKNGMMIVKSIETLSLNAYMVKAIQELSAKVDYQEKEIARLKAELSH